MLRHARLHHGERIEDPHRLLMLAAGVQHLAQDPECASVMMVGTEHLKALGLGCGQPLAGEVGPCQLQQLFGIIAHGHPTQPARG